MNLFAKRIIFCLLKNRIFKYKIHSLLKKRKSDILPYPINRDEIYFELDIKEEVDFSIYLGTHDTKELNFLINNLNNHSTFLDIGANIGYYSLVMANKYPDCRILAIEAEEHNYKRLLRHVDRNKTKIECFNIAISNRSGKVLFHVNIDGNRGGSGIVSRKDKYKNTYEVDSLTLTDFIEENSVTKIDGMKIDIEGFEFPVLKHFFDSSSIDLWPRCIIIESFGHSIKEASGSAIELLIKNNYRLIDHTLFNFFFLKS